jgi:site-specific recombinase XerD
MASRASCRLTLRCAATCEALDRAAGRGRRAARAIKRYLNMRKEKQPWLFVSERGQPMTRQAVNYLVRETGERAGLGRVWPHMLRHSCGFALANKGADFRVIQDYLGHRDPRHTVRYTFLAGGHQVNTSTHFARGVWLRSTTPPTRTVNALRHSPQ